jgi:hypothetical protein
MFTILNNRKSNLNLGWKCGPSRQNRTRAPYVVRSWASYLGTEDNIAHDLLIYRAVGDGRSAD